jgi:hypothetical protein
MGFFDRLLGSKRAPLRGSDARSDGPPNPPGHEPAEKPSPSPQRILARARVLAAMVARATLEREIAQGEYTARENERIRRNLVRWIKKSGLNPELEAQEYEFLATPVSRACERDVIDAEWRSEGLAVLMWALQRFELPPYDQGGTEDLAVERIGFLSSVAQADRSEPPRLRPAQEMDRFRSHITIVSWRLTQFRVSREHLLYQDALGGLGAGRTGIGRAWIFWGTCEGIPASKSIGSMACG